MTITRSGTVRQAASAVAASTRTGVSGQPLATPSQPEGMRPHPPFDATRALSLAREVIAIEAEAVARLGERVDASFAAAVQLILECRGRVVVSGIGKSGHIARKIAATLASTGTPAFFVHPAEAVHGDLGMIQPDDVMLAVSYSGESDELAAIVPLARRFGTRLIAISGNPRSTLASHADVFLDGHVEREACPMNLSPTASTTVALALGDALAVVLLEARGFSRDDFARSHPGGALGRQLLTTVGDIMRSGDAVPSVNVSASLLAAILEMSRKGMGMTGIIGDDGTLQGIFTDGDLRRAVERKLDLHDASLRDAMNPRPRTIDRHALAVEAVRLMDAHKISQLLVVDSDSRVIGALNTHDLLRAKVI